MDDGSGAFCYYAAPQLALKRPRAGMVFQARPGSRQAFNRLSEFLIPDDIKKFILEGIDPIAQLEALVLLHSSPDEQWSAAAIAKRLYISEQETMPILARLVAAGLIIAAVDKPPLYRYWPNSSELSTIVDKLIETYSKHLVPVGNRVGIHVVAALRLDLGR